MHSFVREPRASLRLLDQMSWNEPSLTPIAYERRDGNPLRSVNKAAEAPKQTRREQAAGRTNVTRRGVNKLLRVTCGGTYVTKLRRQQRDSARCEPT